MCGKRLWCCVECGVRVNVVANDRKREQLVASTWKLINMKRFDVGDPRSIRDT